MNNFNTGVTYLQFMPGITSASQQKFLRKTYSKYVLMFMAFIYARQATS